jgi:hypothetical protein
MIDEIAETTISTEGTATVKRLISDEEQLREFEMMELQEVFAENELRWRRKTDYKAAERANAPRLSS